METSDTQTTPSPCGRGRSAREASDAGEGAENTLAIRHSLLADEVVAIARIWLGTPYVHQASVKGAGCDCLGLLRGVWRELHGDEPEETPPYSADWAEATGAETLYLALRRHLSEIDPAALAPGDVALFRMTRSGPAKHCGIVALRQRSGSAIEELTLIHARQNRRVTEEPFSPFWRRHLTYAFRL